ARGLRRNPAFSLTVIVTLALGVGANTAVYSVLHGIVLRPMPYRDAGSIVVVRQQFAGSGIAITAFSVPEINDYRAQTTTLSSIVEYFHDDLVLQDGNVTERVRAGVVSHDFFELFGVR